MENIIYRKLELEDCERINDINPTQFIGKAWCEMEGR